MQRCIRLMLLGAALLAACAPSATQRARQRDRAQTVLPAPRADEEPAVAEAPEAEPAPSPLDAVRAEVRSFRWPADERGVEPSSCLHESIGASEGEASIVGFHDQRLDDAGRVVLEYWNSDAVGLSGEIRHRFDERGARVSTQEIPYESIDEGPPPRPAPITYRYRRAGDVVTVVSSRRGRAHRTERYRFDSAGRVVEYTSEPASTEEEDPVHARCTYDEAGRPTVRISQHEQTEFRTELVYEGDRLVEERVSSVHGTYPSTVWAIDGGFVVFSTDGIERWRGQCGDVFFEECNPRSAPRPSEDRPPAALPAIHFGRPIGDG